MSGLGTLLRLGASRDRIWAPIWILGLGAMVAYFCNVVGVVLESGGLDAMFTLIKTPSMALMAGPGYGFEDMTVPTFVTGVYGQYVMVGAALMSIFSIVRHTRAGEVDGTAELVRAGAVSRHAPLASAVILTAAMNLVLAAIIVPIMRFAAIDPAPALEPTCLFAASVAGVGLTFTGIAALTAQLSATTRGASGLAGGVLGLSYVLRGLGDVSRAQDGDLEWLAWISPIGWAQRTAPFVLDRWWPLALHAALALTALAVAWAVQGRRDLGVGLLHERLGRPQAGAWLSSPLALAFRLQRGSLLAWTLALAVAGALFGSFSESIVNAADGLPDPIKNVLGNGATMAEGFSGFLGVFFGIAIAGYAVGTMNAVRQEETSGRTEQVLAGSVGRPAWLLGWTLVSMAGAVWLTLVAGASHAVSASLSLGNWDLAGDIVLGHVAHAAGVAVFVGIAVLLYGAAPRIVPLAFLPLVAGAFLAMFGRMMELDEAVLDLSPFQRIGQLPGDGIEWGQVALLVGIAVVLTGLGVLAFRRRDLRG